MKKTNISFSNVILKEGFWLDRYHLNADVSIHAVKDRFEETGRFDAVRFLYDGGDNKPHFFYDSDVAKWIEAVGYLLQMNREKFQELEIFCDEMIDRIEENQMEDGYFNSYFQQVEPNRLFQNRYDHELYCAGHFMEAAISYHNATGKDKLLNCMKKCADHIYDVFYVQHSATFDSPGHEEIELALVKLYQHTGDEKYLTLSKFFIDVRGTSERDVIYFRKDMNGQFCQSHLPVRQQESAVGHAVRAVYLYTGMADIAYHTNDPELLKACKTIYADILNKMYISGGIGPSRFGEAFTVPYDLPNLTAYCETCAAIGMVYFCLRMQMLENDATYAEVIEREIYNGFLSSTSLDGRAFFYENPLEVCRNEKDKDTFLKVCPRLPIWKRKEVFECSCCPPNINRFVASIGDVIYSVDDDSLYINQFIASELKHDNQVKICTKYPAEGEIKIQVDNLKCKYVKIRIPAWSKEKFEILVNGKSATYTMEKGYLCLPEIKDGDIITLKLDMSVQFVYSNTKVRENAGKVAVMRGPVVYCLEEVDNGPNLYNLLVDKNATFKTEYNEMYHMVTLECEGFREVNETEALYQSQILQEPTQLKFIPYYAFANREDSDMIVWVRPKTNY